MTQQQDLVRLRAQLKKQRAEALHNLRILKRAQRRELALLEADSIAELLRSLTAGMQSSFDIAEATVVVWDPDHEIRHLIAALSQEPLPDGVRLVDRLDRYALVYRKTGLGPFESRHARLFRRSDRLASVAIIPLSRDGTLIGSLNLGSAQRSRFSADHATDFLDHLGVIASFCLENAVNRARLRRSGFTDVLTGWHNRRYLEVRMSEELSRALRAGHELACLMIDVDHFKQINDQHGHLVGDEVLREVARRVATQVRASDVAARYGGEEFVVLLPATDAAQARRLAERIREVVSGDPVPGDAGTRLEVTVSVGVAAIRPAAQPSLQTQARTLLDAADGALYAAKQGGRDRVKVA